jgi:hypothetical protein
LSSHNQRVPTGFGSFSVSFGFDAVAEWSLLKSLVHLLQTMEQILSILSQDIHGRVCWCCDSDQIHGAIGRH